MAGGTGTPPGALRGAGGGTEGPAASGSAISYRGRTFPTVMPIRSRAATTPRAGPGTRSTLWAVVLVLLMTIGSLFLMPSPASATSVAPSHALTAGGGPAVAPTVPAPITATVSPVLVSHAVRSATPSPPTTAPLPAAAPPPAPEAPAASPVLPPPGQVVQSVTVGTAPEGVVYDPFNHYVYVANTEANSVTILNGTIVVATIAVGNYPAHLAYDRLNHYVYVADYTSDAVSVINGTKLLTTIHMSSSSTAGPFGIANDPANGWTYVSEYNGEVVAVIKGLVVAANISVHSGPNAVAYDPANGDIYVSCYNANVVDVINLTKRVASVTVGTGPNGVAVNTPTGDIYISDQAAASVTVLSGTNQLVNTVTVGASPEGIAYDAGNGYVYVGDYSANNLSVINGTKNVATIPVGGHPFDIAYDAVNGCLYVSRQNGNTVVLVSTLLVEGPMAPNPVGKPTDSADVGQAVTFSAAVWYLGTGTPTAVGSVRPAFGLGCPTNATFTYAAGVGALRWACHPQNATIYTVAFNVSNPTGPTVSTRLTFQVYPDPNASGPDVNIGYKNYLTMVDVGQVVNISEQASGGTGMFTSFLWETFPIDMCVNTSTPSPVCVFTRIMSPSFTNNGTEIFAPPSIVATLLPPCAVLPLSDGGASTTLNSILTGISIVITLSSKIIVCTRVFGLRKRP